VSGYVCFRCGRTNPTDLCPHCAAADEEYAAEQRHNDLIRSQEEALHKQQNPGDYDCPHCLYRTLKLGASRCPMCHGQIGAEFWRLIQQDKQRREEQAERERRRRAAEEEVRRQQREVEEEKRRIEWEKAAPAREAEAARQEHERAITEYKKELPQLRQYIGLGLCWGIVVWFLVGCAVAYGTWLYYGVGLGRSDFSAGTYGFTVGAICAGAILVLFLVGFAVELRRVKHKWSSKVGNG